MFKIRNKLLNLILVSLTVCTVTQAKPSINVTETDDEGQASWKITTPTATYYYHKEGAGFSSILDPHGNDWIDYHPWGGSEGLHRGIPNMVFGDGGYYFHPGHSGEKGSASTLAKTDSGILITSVSGNGEWTVTWEILETHATMTVEKAGGAYWFLYEGTPGGGYDVDLDWYLLPDGSKKPVDQDTVGDLPDNEWIVFGEKGLETVFFLAHHEDDTISDTYMHWWNMTVFGFGRGGREDFTPKMTAEGRRFSIGFLENGSHRELASRIDRLIETD